MISAENVRLAIQIGITPAVLEHADRETLVKLSRQHAFSLGELRAIAARWGISNTTTPATPAKES